MASITSMMIIYKLMALISNIRFVLLLNIIGMSEAWRFTSILIYFLAIDYFIIRVR